MSQRQEAALGLWSFLKRTYATADPRSLGLLRVALGTLLFVDLARRLPDLQAHYANTGWLSNHLMLFRPMSSHLFSVHLAFGTPGEVLALFCIQLLVYLLFTLGLCTRVMHLLSVLLLISVNSRNVAVENGGFVVLTLLSVWTLFLPLGRRFSIDALRASLRSRREGTEQALNDRSRPLADSAPVASVAVAALILQWTTIYYFNVVHKTGATWRDGTAVHYFFQQDRMVTAFGAMIRDYIPLFGVKLMTYGALVIEAVVTVLLISPFATNQLRMLAWLMVCVLHLSIDSIVQLGPFSYAMMTVFFAFIPREFWEWSAARFGARRPSAEVEFNPHSGLAITICRLLKRFDALERLRFVANPELKSIAARASGPRRVGLQGLREVAAALPVPLFARAVLRLPVLSNLLRRSLNKPRRASTYWGLQQLPGSDEQLPEPSVVRRKLAAALGYAREGVVVLLMVVAVSQVLLENRAVPQFLKPDSRPEWMTAIIVYPRMFQGWSMFAPSPPLDDGVLVVDGVTKDGRRLDPLTGNAPSFDLEPEGGFGMNQLWGDFQRRIHEDRFKGYWDGLKDFLRNHHKITGNAQDELVAFDVYFVVEALPPPGQPHKPPTRRKLFSFGSMPQGSAPERP